MADIWLLDTNMASYIINVPGGLFGGHVPGGQVFTYTI
jgi:hypothetical protein